MSIATERCLASGVVTKTRACAIASLVLSAILSGSAQQTDRFTLTKSDEVVLEHARAAKVEWDRHGLVYQDDALNAYLTKVAQSMLPDEPLEHVSWRFGVLRDSMANAISLPDGSIYVNSGTFALLQNEDQLAAILGHEIAHVIDRHVYLYNRQYRKKSLAKNVIIIAGSVALRTSGVRGVSGWGVSIALISTIAPWALDVSVEGYGRDNERAADIRGLDRVERAGYDPAAMQEAFVLMRDQLDAPAAAEYHGDHPTWNERIRTTARPSADREADKSTGRRERFLAAIAGIRMHNVSLDLSAGRFRAALLNARALLERDRSPGTLCLVAEVHRAAGPYPTDPRLPANVATKKSGPPKRTPDEERARLLRTTDGRTTWQTNFAAAEALYLEARSIDPDYADAARGLGSLYEDAGDAVRAVREYRRYVELAPDAPDRRRIDLRLERLGKALPGRYAAL
jgi:Zn-dependent protease with chaperone function